MSKVSRLLGDLIGIAQTMPMTQSLKWYANLATNAPTILKTKHLYSADNAMDGTVTFLWRGVNMDFELDGAPPQTFSWLREFFVRDNYFRAFDMQKVSLRRFVDLGCNVGRVSQIVSALSGGTAKIIAVDADDYTQDRFRGAIAANPDITFIQALIVSGTDGSAFDREAYNEFVGKYGHSFGSNTTHITLPDIISMLDGHVDFMKIDIEGAEFDILLNNQSWLKVVDNIAMEVHEQLGDPADIIDELSRQGFATDWKGNHEDDVAPHKAEFIFASRTGALKHPRRQART